MLWAIYWFVTLFLDYLLAFPDSVLTKLTKLLNAAVLLKKFSGEEGERVDVSKLFGYIGLFTLVALWWLGKCIFPVLFRTNLRY